MIQALEMQIYLHLVWLQQSRWARAQTVPPTRSKHVRPCSQGCLISAWAACGWGLAISSTSILQARVPQSTAKYCKVQYCQMLQSHCCTRVPCPMNGLGSFQRGQASSCCSQPLSVAQRQYTAECRPAGSMSIDCFLAPSCVTYSPSRASSTGTAPNSKTSSCCRAKRSGFQVHTVAMAKAQVQRAGFGANKNPLSNSVSGTMKTPGLGNACWQCPSLALLDVAAPTHHGSVAFKEQGHHVRRILSPHLGDGS